MLIFLPLVVLIAHVRATPAHNKLNGWFSCPAATFSDAGSMGGSKAECAVYTAPLCYPGICEAPEDVDDTVDIFVKRFSATSGDSDTASNVWFVQGGPGFSSTTLEPTIVELHGRLNGAVNIYTMDHRGTGRSTLLDCVAAQAATTGSPWGSLIETSEVPSCAQALENKFGNLASFSTTTAATDLATFISKFTNGATTIVYGASYGTALVERLMHLDPPEVTGYVFDSVASSSGASSADKFSYFSTYDTDFGEVGDVFLDLCVEDKKCHAGFPKGLRKSLQHLIDHFDKSPNSTCATLVGGANDEGGQSTEPPSYTLRRYLGTLLTDANTRTLIPPIVHRLQRCSAKDIDVLKYLVKALSSTEAAPSPDDAYTSWLLYYLIVYSEMWESPQPSESVMTKRFTDMRISDGGMYSSMSQYCAFFSKEDSPTCNQFDASNYKANGIIYERDQYWNKSAIIPKQASALLLSGGLDPQTSSKYNKYLLEALDGENKEWINFEYAGHCTVWTTSLGNGDPNGTCGMQLLASYVKNNGDLKSLDKSCVDEMPALNLTAPIDIVNQYFYTDDAYDGVYLGEDTSSSSSQGEASA